MKRTSGGSQGYIPGTYARRTPNGMKLAETKMRDWERQRQGRRAAADTATLAPTICISRKIGVGALEIADLVAERIDYRVVDREILEHIANHAELREKTVAFFDEKYSGRMAEFITLLFGEKSFIKSDYARHLAETVFTVANLEPTVFVGRGAHLILPRDRVLAVRLICGEAHRVGRLCDILGMDAPAAKSELKKRDREQREFFKKVFGKSDAAPYEFDLVINCDHIAEPSSVATVVIEAFEEKFHRLGA